MADAELDLNAAGMCRVRACDAEHDTWESLDAFSPRVCAVTHHARRECERHDLCSPPKKAENVEPYQILVGPRAEHQEGVGAVGPGALDLLCEHLERFSGIDTVWEGVDAGAPHADAFAEDVRGTLRLAHSRTAGVGRTSGEVDAKPHPTPPEDREALGEVPNIVRISFGILGVSVEHADDV